MGRFLDGAVLTCVGLVLRHVPQQLVPAVVLRPASLRHVGVRVRAHAGQGLHGHLVQHGDGRAAHAAPLAQGVVPEAVAALPPHVPVTNDEPVQYEKDDDGHLH